MGSAYSYKCTNSECGYEATISGGKSCGFCGEVESMTCLDCKELMDVLTAPAPDLKPIEPRCDECKGQNLKKFYSGRTRCPKCGSRLKKDTNSDIMWD
jgi:predicted nucleic acid-binding Zn ribbon protein